MEVIEDGNIMDRIPILLQRDFEYYQKNQTVLSETVCPGVVGGRLDFPRNASFASVKIVLWLEEEFLIAFRHGSGMFVTLEDEQVEAGVAKTSDPDKFVQVAIKSSEMLLEHLHVLAQEALDHADLPVLTATLGAAALLKNSLHCYVQHLDDSGSAERHSLLLAAYKNYVTMSEAVAERVLDLHNRVLSLYILQDSGGRPIDDQSNKTHDQGSPSVQGWWLYMQGSRKDLWDTVPPRMAQRIFAGMLNETLTILNVRYCQTITNETATPLLLNDILNILLCVAQLLPSICGCGADLAGFDVKLQTRDVRDVHAKCNELFKCLVYRGAELHYIHQAFTNMEEDEQKDQMQKEHASPWFTFASPHLFENLDEEEIQSTHQLPTKTAIGLELIVLLAQPQPSWPLLVKILMMRDCHLSRKLVHWGCAGAGGESKARASGGRWFQPGGCGAALCTADGFCTFTPDKDEREDYARLVGALTYVLSAIGSKAELKSTLVYALEISGKDWAACLDKRQVWCDRRPSWLSGMLGLVGTTLHYIPPILVNAVQTGASMYQTMSLCLSCLSRTLDCIPSCFVNATSVIEKSLPLHIRPVGGSVLLQLLITVVYEELLIWAKKETKKEKSAISGSNGEAHSNQKAKPKQVRIMSRGQTASSTQSFEASHSSRSSIATAVAEALCSIDEDDKHTREIEDLVAMSRKTFTLSNQFGLEDFPEFAGFLQEGSVPGSNAERVSDAAVLTSQILMTPAGRDSLRVIYNHLVNHSERLYKELNIQEMPDCTDAVPLMKAPLLYIMFHIGRRSFDQYLRKEWPMPWSVLVNRAKSLGGASAARVHVARRSDFRSRGNADPMIKELNDVFRSSSRNVIL